MRPRHVSREAPLLKTEIRPTRLTEGVILVPVASIPAATSPVFADTFLPACRPCVWQSPPPTQPVRPLLFVDPLLKEGEEVLEASASVAADGLDMGEGLFGHVHAIRAHPAGVQHRPRPK